MKKLLIANRGEIAVRIIRACRDYGIKSVAVYADADMDALFVRMADEAYALDGNQSAETYLNGGRILAIAKRSGADAVHPGYGFLSEQAEFAAAVQQAGLLWVGPDPEVIEKLGDKVAARRIAQSAGAPLAAGSEGTIESGAEVLAFAEKHGFPVAIKAAHGGGGRGMKVVWKAEDAAPLYDSAVREALAAFGRGECYVEQFLDRPRHIEAQVIADKHGNVVVAGTRDCSLQRRSQKLVEEAPAPFLSDEQRRSIHEAAAAICAKAGYSSAGTVEFLLGANGVISFLEVNTRLQVEHPVTEETAGLDLVVEQLRIAEGKELSVQQTPAPRGHAFEFRINAEDVGRGFLPSPGEISRFQPPSGAGIRLDSGVVSGSIVAPMFDSLMAKLIVTGRTRQEAIARARRALAEFEIEGVASVLPFHRAVLGEDAFVNDEALRVHTRWIETEFAQALEMAARSEPLQTDATRYAVEIDGKRVMLGLPATLLRQLGGGLSAAAAMPADDDGKDDETAVKAPVPGTIQLWQIKDGDTVEEGQQLGLMEAMKMETPVIAHKNGKIALLARQGSVQAISAVIARIEPA
ncbi:MAG: Acetyl/propionyl-CoA carboxylase alpha subunit [Candidatus Tokpelaia hoelldobleri]|uniref:Acetyl/propionyl-CoA carboxylase alpha subunit n=1 Tax=Candidatus Tokpelaia hoelldobleri TaxID=1902579 RepID=A0A1U9JUQ0_9HYPH|nr:MAG: Acetyl/propionyl-CoA carboxylase alpha subunit [Candidatus Tokpelaia hoelldoblerii]